ncbi:hypothetical protein [Sulfuracidifex metallicus]|uniref:hypothetical protein n=1 Tax=Sulfuracidifex metallicus TaxID=47303 RepID=UPI00210ACDD5|nr:hypothetical protein [Sulfuracidifex metallicus]
MSEIVKDLTEKTLSKVGYNSIKDLDIKYYQEFKDRYDVLDNLKTKEDISSLQ